MIQTRNLKKSFGAVQAVRDLSFSAPDGAITGLLGSNGAGKTTTLRMICGVLQPDNGWVRIDKPVGALLDHIGLYPRLTARENLAYFGELRGIPPIQLAQRIEQVLSQLGMDAIADRRTAGFSQGERMKTALARAILHSPQNLLLDEPTNGLDVPSVRASAGCSAKCATQECASSSPATFLKRCGSCAITWPSSPPAAWSHKVLPKTCAAKPTANHSKTPS